MHARKPLERAQRADRAIDNPDDAGPVAADARLGHLAERRAEAPVGSEHLRALALLEGIRHGSGGCARSPLLLSLALLVPALPTAPARAARRRFAPPEGCG